MNVVGWGLMKISIKLLRVNEEKSLGTGGLRKEFVIVVSGYLVFIFLFTCRNMFTLFSPFRHPLITTIFFQLVYYPLDILDLRW